jgi:hypothetical protein
MRPDPRSDPARDVHGAACGAVLLTQVAAIEKAARSAAAIAATGVSFG